MQLLTDLGRPQITVGPNEDYIRLYPTSSWQEFSREMARFVGTQSRINLIFYSMITLISDFVIANTTMMIISRQTRMVGIRRAMGATRWPIQRIFLRENLRPGLPGGLLGLALGALGARAISALVPSSGFGGARLEFSLRPELLLLARSFALVQNLVAGIYPACMAAKLDPVEAISGE